MQKAPPQLYYSFVPLLFTLVSHRQISYTHMYLGCDSHLDIDCPRFKVFKTVTEAQELYRTAFLEFCTLRLNLAVHMEDLLRREQIQNCKINSSR